MRNEIAAYGKTQEKNMENVLTTLREMRTANQAMLDRFESRNREDLAKRDAETKDALAEFKTEMVRREKNLMLFIVAVAGVSIAIARYIFG